MKNLIEKFKQQPLPFKFIILVFVLWAYPFIESRVVGAQGFGDLSIISNIIMGISTIPIGFMVWAFLIKPISHWISRLVMKLLK